MLISERIYQYMEEKKITQKEFADRTGIAQSTVSDWRRKGTNPSADKIMNHSHALCRYPQRNIRHKDIIVYKCRSMSHFHKYILAHHSALKLFCIVRTHVVPEDILCDTCSLRLPVRPDTHGAIMDDIPSHDDINSSMELDTRDLGAAQLHHIVDVMDVVVLNDAEDTSHSADDAALLAVVDVAAADDVASHLLLQPPVVLSPAHGIPLHLGRPLHMVSGEEVVVVRMPAHLLPQISQSSMIHPFAQWGPIMPSW